MKQIRYHPAAQQELDEAIAHDEAALPGRGLRFEQQVLRVLSRLRRLPASAPIWPGFEDGEVRCAKVRRYPFLVVYMAHGQRLIILAVAHTKKKPGYWANRLGATPQAGPPAPRGS